MTHRLAGFYPREGERVERRVEKERIIVLLVYMFYFFFKKYLIISPSLKNYFKNKAS